MGLLDFLRGVINSEEDISHDNFIKEFLRVAHAEKIIEKIDEEVIGHCNKSLDIVQNKINRVGELKKHIKLWTETKSGRSKRIVQTRFIDFKKEYTEEKKVLEEEKDTYNKIQELERNDLDIVMNLLHKIEKLRNFEIAESLHAEIAKKELFAKLAKEESSDKELSSEIRNLNLLLNKEESYLKYFKEHKLSRFYGESGDYLKNLSRQKKILNDILNIEKGKKALVHDIIKIVEKRLGGVREPFKAVLYVPPRHIGLAMRTEFKGYLREKHIREELFDTLETQVERKLSNKTKNERITYNLRRAEEHYTKSLAKRQTIVELAVTLGILPRYHYTIGSLTVKQIIAYSNFLIYNDAFWKKYVPGIKSIKKPLPLNYLRKAYESLHLTGEEEARVLTTTT